MFENKTLPEKIRVAILENHQGIIDGYCFRLEKTPDIEIVATATFGEALEPMLAQHSADVLLLDVEMPTSPENLNSYPILFLIPRLLQTYPNLSILVISMHTQRTLIKAVMEAGASGYVVKDDQTSICDLASVIRSVARGDIHLSQNAFQQLIKGQPDKNEHLLTSRQLEVLSLCAAYPGSSTADLASRLFIANSTVRNLLSEAYLKLEVRNRGAAIAKARHLGLLPPDVPGLDLRDIGGNNG
jgi:DNA-binding NarL/FixJ family response regulator